MKLEKPGSGLPTRERLFIKNFLVPVVRVLFTWDIAVLLIKREIRIIKNIVNKVPREKCNTKVIIDRTFAIEDDTRQFSINMVLEHLMIAGNLVQNVIEELSNEIEYKDEITIQGVKPHENKLDQLDEFLAFYENYFLFIKQLSKKQSKKTKPHPWFVSFNNYDWSVFMFMHTFIHRRQLEAIIKKVGETHE